MQYCSLEFSYLGLPVAMHSRWSEARIDCTLHLFADHRHAQFFLPELPRAEAQEFARCMMRCALPADIGEEGMCRIGGAAACALTNFLVFSRQEMEEVIRTRTTTAPDMVGFWTPPAWRVPDAGIILWFHPGDGYRAVIAHTKDQAADVIARLSWLEHEHRESLLVRISRCHIPRQSPHAAQEIRGVCAEVLCYGSLAAKVSRAIV